MFIYTLYFKSSVFYYLALNTLRARKHLENKVTLRKQVFAAFFSLVRPASNTRSLILSSSPHLVSTHLCITSIIILSVSSLLSRHDSLCDFIQLPSETPNPFIMCGFFRCGVHVLLDLTEMQKGHSALSRRVWVVELRVLEHHYNIVCVALSVVRHRSSSLVNFG